MEPLNRQNPENNKREGGRDVLRYQFHCSILPNLSFLHELLNKHLNIDHVFNTFSQSVSSVNNYHTLIHSRDPQVWLSHNQTMVVVAYVIELRNRVVPVQLSGKHLIQRLGNYSNFASITLSFKRKHAFKVADVSLMQPQDFLTFTNSYNWARQRSKDD